VITGVARAITEAFNTRRLDLRERAGAPIPGWSGMPEVSAIRQLRSDGASPRQIRFFLTFTAALDRARDADRLWGRAADLFALAPWIFSPSEISARRDEVPPLLRSAGVSQRHTKDSAGWIRIATSLSDDESSPVAIALADGHGEASELLTAVQHRAADGRPTYPFLGGPKVRVMWVRLLVFPGAAHISGLAQLPVAVDVQIRRVSERLGLAETAGLPLDADVRQAIQDAWASDIAAAGCVGPPELGSSAAAADPAIWFFGKWGCTMCERSRRKMPIDAICARCRFDIG